MKIHSYTNQNFGMAKIINETRVWKSAREKMANVPLMQEQMQRNLGIIKEIFPNEFLHTFENEASVTFKISPFKNRFLAFILPGIFKDKLSKSNNTSVGIFSLFSLELKQLKSKQDTRALAKEAAKEINAVKKLEKKLKKQKKLAKTLSQDIHIGR